MKMLNFYPYYEDYLRKRIKTTTFRATKDIPLMEGDTVMLTIGWEERKTIDLHRARIKRIYLRRICDLIDSDFEGETPDCKSPEAAKLVLSCIYREVLNDDDEIWVVKFEHID